MSDIPKLSEKQIRDRVGERSFGLGQSYFRDGSVFGARRTGNTLKARCQGSRDEPYRVEVTFDDKGRIAEAECSCPVGDGGFCKHVAAVLLAWRKDPEEFTAVEDLEAGLQRRSKEELIALIRHMLSREPDLESLLEMPLPEAGGGAVSPDAYQRQAEAVFDQSGGEWGASGAIADELHTILEVADGFLRKDNPAGAAAVYQGVAAAVLDRHETADDEPGHLHRVIADCVEGLQKCWDTLKDDADWRRSILRTYFDVLAFDLDLGGGGMSDCLPDLQELANPEERRLLADWTREAMAGADDWARRSYGRFLLDLEADTLDDESFLRVCRETGRLHDLVDRLLQLGRLDEALREVEQAGDYELMSLADLLVSHRHGEEAERLVRERSKHSQDVRLLEWLQKRASGRKDTAAALELAQSIFARQPGLELYKEIRTLAKKQKSWDELRPKVMAALKKNPQHNYVLVPIYLEEGEIDEALEAVKKEGSYGFGYYGQKLEVAKAAEKTRPRAALDIYRRQAEGLIAQRGRSSYAAATEFLKKVRSLYKQMDDEEAWARYAASLRQKHKSLRALQEEMTKARL